MVSKINATNSKNNVIYLRVILNNNKRNQTNMKIKM